jgi:Protein of unknown function (DUF3300)
MIRSAARMAEMAIAILSIMLLPVASVPLMAQNAPARQQLLTPEQLDNLVAPVALYPDPLLSEVLAASTYPLEIVEAQQWLQQNSNLTGTQLMDAAKQQPWDPSVQALVAFPDALDLLNRDIRWSTDLGNAFLAQQSDVMAAVQRMRARAEANGKLATTPQEVVTTTTQGGNSAIEIAPANPQVIYVPVYDPVYVWGPPVWDPWPLVWYPGYSFGFSFGAPCYVDTYFAGFGGWGGWGWGFNWFGPGGGLFVNTVFFNRYRFYDFGGYGRGFDRDFGGRFGGGRVAWAHDPGRWSGGPYANRGGVNRFGSGAAGGNRFSSARFSATRQDAYRYNNGGSFANRSTNTQARGSRFGGVQTGGTRFNAGGRFNAAPAVRQSPSIGRAGSRGTASNGWRSFGSTGRSSSLRAQGQSARGYNAGQGYRAPYSNYRGSGQGYRAPAQNYRAPSNNFSGRSFSTPRSRAQNFSAPRYSSPRPAGRSFSAPRQYSAPRGFSGGSARSFAGGRSFGGGGGRSFGGGGRSFGGGGGRSFGGGGGGRSSRGGRR